MRVYGYDNERFTQLTAEQLVTMDKGRRTESPKNSGEWWRETCCPFPCR